MKKKCLEDGRYRLLIGLMCLIFVEFKSTVVAAGNSVSEDGKGSAYGIVLRKQSSGNRIIIQPLEGLFLENAAIQYHNVAGDVVCGGKVQKVYSNLVYSVAEECDKFDSIRPGFGVTFNTDADKMSEIYDSKDKIDEVVRENEWKRSFGIPMEIGDDQFENIVKRSKVPVLFEIYALWCPRCTEFKPVIGEVAKDLEGKVRVAIADGEKCRELEKELGLKGYPSLFLFIDGVIVDKWSGAYKDKIPVLDRINRKIKMAGKE